MQCALLTIHPSGRRLFALYASVGDGQKLDVFVTHQSDLVINYADIDQNFASLFLKLPIYEAGSLRHERNQN